MDQRYYIYLLHESPVEWPYYCKVGYTSNPLQRLQQLQEGNPRSLRALDYPHRPPGEFGLPLPSLEHARALESLLFDRFVHEGITLHGDFDYSRGRACRREWVAGLHPERLLAIVESEWLHYVHHHGLI